MQCVKWRNHKETMTEHFFEMLHTNNLTDCAISADGRSISAHRLILAAASPYFRDLFKSNESRCDRPMIVISGFSFSDVMNCLEFVYTGSIKIPFCQLNHFMKVSKTLGLVGVPDISFNEETPKEKPIKIKAIKVEKIVKPTTSTPIKVEADDIVEIKTRPRSLSDCPPSLKSDPNYSPSQSASTSSNRKRKAKKSRPSVSIKTHKCSHCHSNYSSRHSVYSHERFCYSNPNRSTSRCSICSEEVRPGSMVYHKRRYHQYKPSSVLT